MKHAKLLILFAIIGLAFTAQNDPFNPKQINDGWKTEKQYLGNRAIEKMDSLVSINGFKQISSIVIAQNGKVIFENYYNDNNADTKHNTRSATKTITGTLIGGLIQDGLLQSVNEVF